MYISKSKMSTLLVLVAVLMLSLQGCMAAVVPPEVPPSDVWALSQMSTLAGAKGVISGTLKIGAILQKDNILCVMWPIRGMGWASIFIDTAKMTVISNKNEVLKAMGQAGIFNSATMGDFTAAMKSNGFVEITFAQVPAFVAAALNSVKSYPVLVLPAGFYTGPEDLMPAEIKQ